MLKIKIGIIGGGIDSAVGKAHISAQTTPAKQNKKGKTMKAKQKGKTKGTTHKANQKRQTTNLLRKKK